MAVYTMELKDVIETIFNPSMDPTDWEQTYASFTHDSVTWGKLPTVPDYTKLGLGTYPIFDEPYRPILNGLIIDHFFDREIGVETIDMWQLYMRRKMDLIMPRYNKLFESEKIPYEALQTMDIHSVGETETDGTETITADNTGLNTATNKGRAVNSETPQTILSGYGDYATSAADNSSTIETESTTNQESASTSNTETNNDNRVTGFQGVASDLVMRYRGSLMNFNQMILDELEENFMGVLGNADSFTVNYPYFGIGY